MSLRDHVNINSFINLLIYIFIILIIGRIPMKKLAINTILFHVLSLAVCLLLTTGTDDLVLCDSLR
jgi:hypothetical protein